jgi:hypothetical protein
MEKKIKPSDLDREAQRLIDSSQMPSLESLLTAIADMREKYRDQVLSALLNAARIAHRNGTKM